MRWLFSELQNAEVSLITDRAIDSATIINKEVEGSLMYYSMSPSPELLKAGYKEGDLEVREIGRDNTGQQTYGYSGFPKPAHAYDLVLEEPNKSIEMIYYWILEHIREDQGFRDIHKISDIFAASEHSAFFGSAKQRIGLQQDKVVTFLATIGKMVRDLFQLVREIRVLDERLSIYGDSYNIESTSRESSDITLKGIWIDMVEQGRRILQVSMAWQGSFNSLHCLTSSSPSTHPLSER
jgi:hypothetical protein